MYSADLVEFISLKPRSDTLVSEPPRSGTLSQGALSGGKSNVDRHIQCCTAPAAFSPRPESHMALSAIAALLVTTLLGVSRRKADKQRNPFHWIQVAFSWGLIY